MKKPFENRNNKKRVETRVRGWLPQDNLGIKPQTIREWGRLKIRFPKGTALMFGVLAIITVLQFLEGNVMAALFLWFACIVGVSSALDLIGSAGKAFNEKLAATLMFAVVSLGGVLVNLYIFYATSNFALRVFSLTLLCLVSVPMMLAGIAYVWGKREQSKKLFRWYFAGR